MIASLTGTLAELTPSSNEAAVQVVLDVGGVGYLVLVGSRTAARLGPIGSSLSLKVHTHVREGAITLYGFANVQERSMFELLVSAHGVGPSLGLAILGVHEPAALASAVSNGDLEQLVRVPGVGRKTAQRLVVELGERFGSAGLDGTGLGSTGLGSTGLDDTGLDGAGTSEAPDASRSGRPGPAGTRSTAGLVAAALEGLGYSSEEVRDAVRNLPADQGVEESLKLALAALAPAT